MIQGIASHLSSGSVSAPAADIVYGRCVAVQSLIESFWRHTHIPNCDFFFTADPITGESCARDLLRDTLKPHDGKSIGIWDVQDLKENFKSFHFDVWHDFDADIQCAAAMRSRLSSRLFPITATVHILSYQGLLGGWILDILLHRLYACDAIVCTTQSCQKALANLIAHVADRFNAEFGTALHFPGELPVIPYSVDTELFRPGRRTEARSILRLPQDAFVIGWIGRLSPVDKADLIPLLQVFARLVRANPHRSLLLLLAGTGPEIFRNALLQCAVDLGIAANVKLITPLPPEQRANVHAACDVFTSPIDNLQETAGITPLEAMASGVPQVLADWDGYREAVEHGKTGFLVPTMWSACDDDIAHQSGIYDDYNLMDHYALAQSVVIDLRAYQQAFQALLDNPALHAAMGAASRLRALAHYSPSVIVEQHESLWERLVQVAHRVDFDPAQKPAFDEPAFFRNFEHYPSAMIAKQEKLHLTEMAKEMQAGRAGFPFYYPSIPGLTQQSLQMALGLLGDPGEFGTSTQRVAERLGISELQARRHVLWLLKQGLLEAGS